MRLYTCKMLSLDYSTVVYLYICTGIVISHWTSPEIYKKKKNPTMVLSNLLIFKDYQGKTSSSNLQNSP